MREATRCISCRGQYQRPGERLKDLMWVEPVGGDIVSPVYLRGFICDECMVVHWALDPEGWSEVD